MRNNSKTACKNKYKNKIIIAVHCKQLTRIVRTVAIRLDLFIFPMWFEFISLIEPMHLHICLLFFVSFPLFLSQCLAGQRCDTEYLKICAQFEESDYHCGHCVHTVHCGNTMKNVDWIFLDASITNILMLVFFLLSLDWYTVRMSCFSVLWLIYGQNVKKLLIEMEWVHLIREMHFLFEN